MMRKLLRPGSWASLAGVLVMGLSVGSADDVGYVRLGPPAKPVVRGQSDVIDQAGFLDVVEATEEKLGELSERPLSAKETGYVMYDGMPVYEGAPIYDGAYCDDCQYGHHGHHAHKCWALKQYLLCKFGYFVPTGSGGAGTPKFGHYSRVYPQDPYYFDGRDGQLWAAQGYGTPVAVPLAPVVGHTYNYGWGIPSSRLTPVSRPAY